MARALERFPGAAARLDGLAPGDHVCWVIEPGERFDSLAEACLVDGARSGQKLFLFAPEQAPPRAPHLEGVVRADPHSAILGRRRLDTETMLERFRREAAIARAGGYNGLRVVADMDWLLAAPPSSGELRSFEQRLDSVVADLEVTVVCAYRRASFEEAHLLPVTCVHPLDVGRVPEDATFRFWSLERDTWALSGEVDFANAGLLADVLSTAAASAAPRRLRVHAGKLRFVDVAGLRALASVTQSVTPAGIALEAAPDMVRRSWRLAGFDQVAPSLELVP